MSEQVLDNYSRNMAELMSKLTDLNREVGVIKAHQDSFSDRINGLQKQFNSRLDELCALCRKNDMVLDDLVKKNHLSQTLYGWMAKNWLQISFVLGFVIIEVFYSNLRLPPIS